MAVRSDSIETWCASPQMQEGLKAVAEIESNKGGWCDHHVIYLFICLFIVAFFSFRLMCIVVL
jgi:hypothetical protein